MLKLLLGPDDFTKKEYIVSLAVSEKAEAEFFADGDAPDVNRLLEQDLFAKKKLFALDGKTGSLNLDETSIGRLAASANIVVLIEFKLDKRLAASKQLLANKKVEVKDFALPHGKDLDRWITSRVKELGGAISGKAADALAKKLGRDESVETKFGGKIVDVKEVFTLGQADSEIKKLLSFAAGQEISEEDIKALVSENSEANALQITNAIAENNRQLVFSLVATFLKQGGDEKSLIIQLNALLGEQFRNILVMQEFLAKGFPESDISEKTGWKSGRVFVLKKIASRFSAQKVKDLLGKLRHLDEELKSSSTPPRVLLELILAQLFL